MTGGYNYVCYVSMGAAACRGLSTETWDDMAAVPAAAQSGVVEVSAGRNHACAVLNSGTSVCWGSDNHAQVSAADMGLVMAHGVVDSVAAGGWHTCVLVTSGVAACYGYNGEGQTNVPAGRSFAALAAGERHTCGIACDGELLCWGWNAHGQSHVPSIARQGAVAVAAGSYHSLALLPSGRVVAWGCRGADNGQCAVPAAAQSGVVAISAGEWHSCALRVNGGAVCWGHNAGNRVLGPANVVVHASFVPPLPSSYVTPSMTPSNLATPAGTPTTACASLGSRGPSGLVAVVGESRCSVKANFTLACSDPAAASEMMLSQRIISVGSGYHYTCVLSESGSVGCSGFTSDGVDMYVAALNISGATSFSAGRGHACTVLRTGSGSCFGSNTYGQASSSLLSRALMRTNIAQVVAGGYHTCVLSHSGVVGCYGHNGEGQTNVPAGRSFAALAAGERHTCGITCTGELLCWGWNAHGQSAVAAMARQGAVAVAAGSYHSLALLPSGRVVAWGCQGADSGQCAVPVAAQSGVVAISAGEAHSCALRANGSAVCWGVNDARLPSRSDAATVPLALVPGHPYRHALAERHEDPLVLALELCNGIYCSIAYEVRQLHTHPSGNTGACVTHTSVRAPGLARRPW